MTTLQSFESSRLQSRSSLAQFLAQGCVIALVSISVTAPAITFSQSFPYLRLEQALLPFVFLIYLWLVLTGFTKLVRFNGMFLVAALFCCSILFSLWYGSAILHHSVILRDYYELPKVWFPVAFFTLGYEAALSEQSLRRLLRFFVAPMLLVCLYAWAQFAKLAITYELNLYYSGGPHIDRALEYGGRVYSTMSNPNVLGQLLTWALVAFTMAALSRIGYRALYVGMAFACLVTLVLTGSRFGLVTSVLGLALIPVMPSSTSRRRAVQLGFLLLLLPMFAWTVQVVARINQPTLERFESLQHPLEVDSLRARVDDLWRDAASDFFKSPLVGNGPAKKDVSGVVTDSEYLDVLKQFGLIGFLPYIAFYLFPLVLMWRGLQSGRRAGPFLEERLPATFMILRLGIVMTLTALVMNIALTTFYNQLLQGFLWLWLGLGARSAKTIFDSISVPRVTTFNTFEGSAQSEGA